ncbi:guanine deaminase [Candidatus Spongiihabitans sp.]|uniref:guanine deaminase n=1 Tax=Candidatus Spongiihabitans sp. TaxID=3101308 RepID=UPI003C7AAA79
MTVSAHRGEILHCLDDPRDYNNHRQHNNHGNNRGEAAWQYFADGLLIIEDGHVAACGEARRLLSGLADAAEIHQHADGLILPGFIDAHIHYPQCEIIAAYGAQLIDWLQRYTFPAEAKFEDSNIAAATAEFFLDELLRNGTTTALVFGTVHAQSVDAFFTQAAARNLRMICGKVMMDRNAPQALCDTPQSSFDDSRELIARWHGKGRLGYAVTPRFAPTSSAQQLRMAGKLLSENPGVHLHTHLAENTRECQWVGELFPQCKDYLDVYDQHGLLGRRSVFAHGIHLSDREWRRLQQSESNLAFCPTSNLFIGSGLFDLRCADRHQVRVALGTDVGGGDSFSLLRTINEAYKVQQLQQHNLSPLRALYLATLGGARALDLHQHIGNFERGKEADFIVLDYRATPLINFRITKCEDWMEKLFVMQMLGDDRAIRETWIMGQKKFAR